MDAFPHAALGLMGAPVPQHNQKAFFQCSSRVDGHLHYNT